MAVFGGSIPTLDQDEWTQINPDYPLAPGSILRIHYGCIGGTYLTAGQIAVVERKLESEPTFFVRSHSIPKDSFFSEFYFEVETRTPPKPQPEKEGTDPQPAAIITGAMIAKIIIAALVIGFLYASMKYIEIKVIKAKTKMAEAVGSSAEGLENVSKIVTAVVVLIVAAMLLGVIK